MSTTTNSNAITALYRYNLALNTWDWPLSKALTFASEDLQDENDIDQLQNLLNEQCAKALINETQQIAVRIITRQ